MFIRNLVAITCLLITVVADAQKNQSLKIERNGNNPLNVIFILCDDHRYDFMGFTGKVPWLKTPNMDKMAHNGVWIKNATVTTSLCSPSRASILTGMYAHKHTDGVRDGDYKFIFYPGIWDIDEFFDLKNDPEEKKNLIRVAAYQPIIKKLRDELYDWLEQTGGMQIPLKRLGGKKIDNLYMDTY